VPLSKPAVEPLMILHFAGQHGLDVLHPAEPLQKRLQQPALHVFQT
jgi:hypothetical protein